MQKQTAQVHSKIELEETLQGIFPSVLGQHLPDLRLSLHVFVKSFLKYPMMEMLESLWVILSCSVLPSFPFRYFFLMSNKNFYCFN